MTRKTTNPTLALILKRRRWGARDAEVVLSAWRESGETASRFAWRHGLVAERLLRWRRQTAATVIRFQRVKVATPHEEVASQPSSVELVLSRGRRVVIRPGFDAALLEDVVRAVESWSC